jgi:hypothetical protein
MKGKDVFETGGAEPQANSSGHISHSVGSPLDERLSKARLVNVRVLANKESCLKIATALEPLALVVTGFQEDPLGNLGVFRMFLAGMARGDDDVDR